MFIERQLQQTLASSPLASSPLASSSLAPCEILKPFVIDEMNYATTRTVATGATDARGRLAGLGTTELGH